MHSIEISGIEAMTIASNHHFPRHSHDQFGFGVIDFGAQRSWSGVGLVEASAGDVIFCNPGEIHDGVPFAGQVRGWRMLYFDSQLGSQPLIQRPCEKWTGDSVMHADSRAQIVNVFADAGLSPSC